MSSIKEHQQALFGLLCEFDRVCCALDMPYTLFAGTLLGAVRHGGFIPWDDDLDVIMLREDYERFLARANELLDREKYCLQAEFSDHWPLFFSKLRLNGTTCLEKFRPKDPSMHQGVYIDIFPCDRAKAGKLGRKIQFYASKVVIAKGLYRRGYDTNSRAKKIFMALCRLMPMKPFLALTKGGDVRSGLVHSFLGASSKFEKSIYPARYLEKRCLLSFEGKPFPVPEDYDGLLTLLYGDYMRLPPENERAVKQHAILVDLQNSYEHYAHYRDGMSFDVHTRSIR